MHSSDTIDLIDHERHGVVCRAVADTGTMKMQITVDGVDRTDMFVPVVEKEVVGSGGLSTVRKEMNLEYFSENPSHELNEKTLTCSVSTEGHEAKSASVRLAVQCTYRTK